MNDATRVFLDKDYDLKVRFLADHYSRMWTRFNFFMVANTAIVVAAAARFGEPGLRIFAGAGMILSACWYVFGAQDRYLVEVYRDAIRRIAAQLSAAPALCDQLKELGYVSIADVTSDTVERKLYQWRADVISTTKLVAWFPLLVFVCWIALFAIAFLLPVHPPARTA